MDEVGEISVVFHRSSEPTATRKPSSRRDFTAAIGNVHEKALKGQAKITRFRRRISSINIESYRPSEALDQNQSYATDMSIPKNWMGRITRRPFFDSNIGREVRQRCRKIKSITDYLSRRCTESLLNIERSPSPDPEIISISASPVNSVKSELVKKEGVRALQGMVRGHASLMSIGTDEQQNSNGGRRSSENTTTVEKGARGRSENPNRVSR